MKQKALIFALLISVNACTAPPEPTQRRTETPPAIVGNDRDIHGCIGSAGYSWCERTSQCERPWELAQQEGFTLDYQTYNEFCSVDQIKTRIPAPKNDAEAQW